MSNITRSEYLKELSVIDQMIKKHEEILLDLKEQRNRLSPEAQIMAQLCAVCADTVKVGECFVYENTLFRVTVLRDPIKFEKPVVAEKITKGVTQHFYGSTKVLVSKSMAHNTNNEE